jgi:NADH dehydrogenase
LSEYDTVGQLMGFIAGEKFRVEGWIAKFVYVTLYRQHILALHGFWRMALDTLARMLRRQVDPKVKLH